MKYALLAVLLLCQTLHAQVVVTVRPVVPVPSDAVRFGDFVEVSPDFAGRAISVGHIIVNTELPIELLQITVTNEKREAVPYSTIPGTPPSFVVTTPGRIWFQVIGVDFDKKLFVYSQTDFLIGPPPPPLPPPTPPTPPGPPKPDVLPDAFDDIGQRVAVWAFGLPNRDMVAAAYRAGAKLLRDDPSQTVNSVSGYLATQLKAVPQYESYSSYAKNLNADLSSRWPLTKGVLATYYDCIAAGLEGAK